MQNDTQIRVNIITAINESGLITSMKKLTDQAKSQAKTLNSVFEQAFKGTQKGVKFGVFQEMLASIKEVSSALKSLPKDMAKTFSTLDRSASTAKKSVDEVSQSLDKVSGKKAKASVDIEIRNAKDVQKVVGEALSKGNFSVGHAKEWVKGVSSSSGVYLTKDQQKNIVQSLTKQYNLDTSAVSGPQIALDTWLKNKESENARAKAYRGAEDRDRSRVNPVTAHQYAMDLQKRQKAPLVESEIIRQKTAYEDKKNFDKLNNEWIKDQETIHKSFRRQQEKVEQERFNAEKDIHKQYVANQKQQANLKIADDATVRKLNADIQKQDAQEQAKLSAQKIAYQKAQEADRKRVTPESATKYALSRPRVGAMTPTEAATFYEVENQQNKDNAMAKAQLAKEDAERTNRNRVAQKSIDRLRRKKEEKELKRIQFEIKQLEKKEKEQAAEEKRKQKILDDARKQDEKAGLYDPQRRILKVDKPVTPYDRSRLSAFGTPDQARWGQGDFKSGDAFINDAKRYVKYAVNDLGMSITDAMKNVSKSAAAQKLSNDRPIGASFIGVKSQRENALREIANSLTSIDKPLDSAGKKMGFLTAMFEKQGEAVKRLGRYYVSFFAITSTIQQFTEAMRQAVAMQDQMLELKKFLPEGSNIGGLRQNAYSMAAEFGVPIDTVLGSFTEFAKQGKQANEILDLTRSALLGVNVASTDFATTVTYLTTVTNVWKNQFSDTSVLIDKLALVQAKSSASSEVLISAMQRSGSMAKTMGVSLDQLFGYISAVSEKTQLSGEVIGTSLKTIIERAQRMKTLNLLQGMEEFKGTQFVSPISGEIMAAPQILETVAKKWGTLTDVQRKYIGEQMAGSRQLNAFTALMENMGRAAELTRDSMNSLGFAQKANESEMAKFSKSFQRASSLMYEMTTSVILPMIGATTSLMNTFSSLINMAPGLSRAFAGAGAGLALFSGAIAMFKSFRATLALALGSVVQFFATWSKGSDASRGFISAVGNTGMWASIARNFTLMGQGLGVIATQATGAQRAIRLFLGASNLLFGPIGAAIAVATMAVSAYNSMNESAAEKQKDFNDRLGETIELLKKVAEAKGMAEREKIATEMAKKITPEEAQQLGIELRQSSTGQLVPKYETVQDLESAKKAIESKYVFSNATGGSAVKAAEAFGMTTNKFLEEYKNNTSEALSDMAKSFQAIQMMTTQEFLLRMKGFAKKGYYEGFEDQDLVKRLQTDPISLLENPENIAKLEKYRASRPAGIDVAEKDLSQVSVKIFEVIQKLGLMKDLKLTSALRQTPAETIKTFAEADVNEQAKTVAKFGTISPQKTETRNINNELREQAEIRKNMLESVRQVAAVEAEISQKRMSVRIGPADDYLSKYAVAQEKILRLDEKIAKAKLDQAETIKGSEEYEAQKKIIEASEEKIQIWKQYVQEISNPAIINSINSISSTVRDKMNQSFLETATIVSGLHNRLLEFSGKTFTIKLAVEAFMRSLLPSWLTKMLFGELNMPNTSPAQAFDEQLKSATELLAPLTGKKKEIASQKIVSELERKNAVVSQTEGDILAGDTLDKQIKRQEAIDKLKYKEPSGGAAKRDRESTAHYNALERIKKAEADLQKQQQMSSYWEGKMPDKYLLKYDAETAKYNAELKAKQAALDSERANLKPEEVKKLQEEINVLQEKIDLQGKYRKQAEEIAAFEKWQSDNRVGMERLRTELSIKSEIYDMEYAALYSPSRADEKSYMEWKIKSAITELEAQRLIAIEEQKVVAIKKGKTEAEALSIAMSTEEVQLLDIKLQKEQQMLGLIDRQLELKQKQRINEQVREVQGMISTGIFDALSMKSKNERKKQLAEVAKEMSKLSEDSNTAAYGIAQAESVGNIDAINASRDKWNEVNRQIEEARKKMDEVNNSTNKWKEVLENIGDSVLKKLADKFAEMLINKTGLGDMLGMVFGGIDGINTGGKGVKGQALPAAGSALAALSLKSPKQSLQMAQEMMGLMVPGSSGSTNYNVSVAGGGGNPLGALLGGGLKFGGAGTSALGGGFAGSKLGANAGFGKAASASSASKYGTSQYLTSAMLGYAIGSSTSNRTVGVLGGAAAGFLTGGPIGALIGGIASLFGRKKGGDEAPPVQPAREYYALFRNTDAIDRNTNTLLKLSEGVWNAPSTFEMNKLQAERNATTINNNITINATGGSAKAIAAEVNAVISNSYQSSMGKMATSTSNWG